MTSNPTELVDKFFNRLIKTRFAEIINQCETCYEPIEKIVKTERPVTYGIVKPGPNIDGGIPVIKVKHYADGTLSSVDSHTSIELDTRYGRSKVLPGDILLSIGGTIGSVAIVPDNLSGANITQHSARLSIVNNISNKYVANALRGEFFQKQVKDYTKGAAMKGLNLSDIRKMKVPIVPYDQQIKLSTFVEQVDKLRAVCKLMFSKYDEAIKSRFTEMFGDLKSGLFNFPAVKLSDLCDSKSSTIQINKLDNSEGQYPLYGASGLVKTINYYSLDKEYIGIVKDGAGVGRASHYPAYSSLVGTMAYLIPKDNCTIAYLEQVMNMLNLGSKSSGSTIPHIYFKDYGKIMVPLPPICLQHKFEQYVKQINKMKSIFLGYIKEMECDVGA